MQWPEIVAACGLLAGGLVVAQRVWDLWGRVRAHTADQVRAEVHVEQLAAEVGRLQLSIRGQAEELAELRRALAEVSHVQPELLHRVHAALERAERAGR
jgi:uncharacterized membrane protein